MLNSYALRNLSAAAFLFKVTSHLQRPKKSILLLFDSTEFKYSTQCFQKKKFPNPGNFDIWNIFSRGVHLPNTPCIFLATPTLDADI